MTASLLPIVQVAQLAITLFCLYISQTAAGQKANSTELITTQPTTPAEIQDPKKDNTKGMSSQHAVDAVDALGYVV